MPSGRPPSLLTIAEERRMDVQAEATDLVEVTDPLERKLLEANHADTCLVLKLLREHHIDDVLDALERMKIRSFRLRALNDVEDARHRALPGRIRSIPVGVAGDLPPVA